MACMAIKKLPDPILRKAALSVDSVTESEKKILKDMAETMRLNGGVGLAATQVGVNQQIAVIDIGEGLVNLINPTISKKEGSDIKEEGCLSIPDLQVNVRRPKEIVVNYLDEAGEPKKISANGLLARVIQHEVDHLTGRLIIDYLNPAKRLFLTIKRSLTARGVNQ